MMKRRKVDSDLQEQIYNDYKENKMTVSQIAKKYSVSNSTVYNVKKSMEGGTMGSTNAIKVMQEMCDNSWLKINKESPEYIDKKEKRKKIKEDMMQFLNEYKIQKN